MGLWSLFLIVVTLFELIKTNLLKNAQIKFVTSTQDPAEKAAIASSSILINFILTLAFIGLILVGADALSSWLVGTTELGTMLKWFIPGIIVMMFFSHLEAVQQSHLDFKGVFAGYFARNFVFLCFLIFHKIADIPFSFTDLVIYQSVSLAAGTLLLYLFSRKYLSKVFRPTRNWIRSLLGYGGYIFGSGTVAALFQNLDQLMIARSGAAFVAPYNVAFRINGLVDIPSYAAADILFPKATLAVSEEGRGKVKYLYEKMVAILLCFTIPAALFIILFPGLVIHIIAGPGYMEAAPILQLYMIAGILRPAQNQAANLLNSIGKTKLCFYINTAYLVVNLGMNFLCLSLFGFYGAAIGTLITFTLAVIYWYFVMRKEIGLELHKIFEYGIGVYKMMYEKAMNFLQKKSASRPV